MRASIISPLTVNGGQHSSSAAEFIPIAVAFNETVHAFFKINEPAKSKLKCFGCMKISFPYAILKLLATSGGGELPQLCFSLNQLHIANQDLKLNQQLLVKSGESDEVNFKFEFITPNLCAELRQQHAQNKQAAFFNFELLKYEFKVAGQQPPPLTLNAQWTSDMEQGRVELALDYTIAFRKQLSQVNFMLIMPLNNARYKLELVRGGEAQATVNQQLQEREDKLQILWQMASLSVNGRLSVKFSITPVNEAEPLSLEQFYQPVYVKFHIDQATLSQVKFSIASASAYKLSLLKEKVETGKYFCSSEPQQPQAQVQQYQQSKTMLMMKPTTGTTANPTVAANACPTTTPISSTNANTSVNSMTSEEINQSNDSAQQQQQQEQPVKKANLTGSLSTHIGSSADVLLNC